LSNTVDFQPESQCMRLDVQDG